MDKCFLDCCCYFLGWLEGWWWVGIVYQIQVEFEAKAELLSEHGVKYRIHTSTVLSSGHVQAVTFLRVP